MQEENDLLRRLNEALSIKIKDLQEDHASPVKLTSKVMIAWSNSVSLPYINE